MPLHTCPRQIYLPSALPLMLTCVRTVPRPCLPLVPCNYVHPPCRVAVKVMPKRFGPDGFLERQFARRVRNEVDIASHLGRRWVDLSCTGVLDCCCSMPCPCIPHNASACCVSA